MEQSKDSSHQVKKIWLNSDIIKNWTAPHIDEKTRRKLVREAARGLQQEFIAGIVCVVHVKTISSILHMSGLWDIVATWKTFHM